MLGGLAISIVGVEGEVYLEIVLCGTTQVLTTSSLAKRELATRMLTNSSSSIKMTNLANNSSIFDEIFVKIVFFHENCEKITCYNEKRSCINAKRS